MRLKDLNLIKVATHDVSEYLVGQNVWVLKAPLKWGRAGELLFTLLRVPAQCGSQVRW